MQLSFLPPVGRAWNKETAERRWKEKVLDSAVIHLRLYSSPVWDWLFQSKAWNCWSCILGVLTPARGLLWPGPASRQPGLMEGVPAHGVGTR